MDHRAIHPYARPRGPVAQGLSPLRHLAGHKGPRMTDQFDTLRGVLDARHSCRAFLPDPVEDEVIARIVRVAGRAPSWCNAQPWQVTLTRGAETERFRE